jgi:hypothetical protein
MAGMAIRETQPFGLPQEIHTRRVDEKLLFFNGLTTDDPVAAGLAAITVTARKTAAGWLVAATDPATNEPFGSFVEDNRSVKQQIILETAEMWIREASATKRVPGRIYPALNPFTPNEAVGYLLVEADPAPFGDRELADVSCDTCVAACCRKGMTILLTDKETAKQRRTMSLQRIKRAVNYERDLPAQQQTIDIAGQLHITEVVLTVPKYYGVYRFTEDCGNLGETPDGGENRPCLIHEDDRLYPEACHSFTVGSPKCLAQRAQYGLDGHEPAVHLSE